MYLADLIGFNVIDSSKYFICGPQKLFYLKLYKYCNVMLIFDLPLFFLCNYLELYYIVKVRHMGVVATYYLSRVMREVDKNF